jgi:uncharacterized damage-inducible protein DinB
MDTATQAELTLREALPWVTMMLDYTDKVAASVPEDMLDWRPADPSGRFCFSLGEIVMHCADARLMFSRQLAGDEDGEDYWTTSLVGPDEEGVWPFRERGGKQELLDSLAAMRARFDQWLDKPASAITEIPETSRALFDKTIAELKEQGQDTAEWEKRGPASIVRVLMALIAHESGHRGALQILLRQHGINVEFAY